MIWNREPALVMGAVQAILALILAFGVDLTSEQVGAILAVSAALLALAVRAKVTPHQAGPFTIDPK
jgi:hypothetical protein